MSDSALIELRDVGKTYHDDDGDAGRVVALEGVTLSIERGASVALLGPSGSGKSTLLHILGCLDRPTSGRYLLDGDDVSTLDVNRLADVRSREVGFVFQRFHLLPRATALQNAALPLRLAGVGTAESEARARELLERVGLGERLGHRPAKLSGGEQQRVAIARGVANRPSIVLADEPTGNLDSRAGAEIVALLEELNQDGTTLVVVTHDETIAARAPRIIRLLDGRVTAGAGPRA